jgi:hypothetical protein
MKLRAVSSLAVVFALASPALAGCKSQIDQDKVQALVKSVCEEKKVKVKSVTCPAGREAKEGDEFDCTGELEDGSKFSAKIKQTDAKGSVLATIVGRFVNLKELGDAMEKSAGPGADVKCSDKTILLRKGDSFTCEIVVGDTKGSVTFTAKDDEANVDKKIEVAGGGAAPAASAAPAEAHAEGH